jgi:hypothetical protein
MSVVLGLSIAVIGLFAVIALVGSLLRAIPAIAALRAALRDEPASAEMRLMVIEHMLVRLRPNRGPLRHSHRPKPILHRLARRKADRSAA